VDSIYDIVWARDPETGREVKYGDVRLADEQQFSVYNFEMAEVEKTWRHFELCEAECKALLDRFSELKRAANEGRFAGHRDPKRFDDRFNTDRLSGEARLTAGPWPTAEAMRFPLLAAYDLCLKCSHYFNILDARGAISVTERVGVIARVRALAVGIAKAWMDQQYPTGKKPESNEQASKAGTEEKRGKLAPVG